MKYKFNYKDEYQELVKEVLQDNDIKEFKEDCFIPLHNPDEYNNGITIISKDSKNELNGFGNIPD